MTAPSTCTARSPASHWRPGPSTAWTITAVDGLVLARSVFEHWLNDRVRERIYAVPRIVTDPAEKLRGLPAGPRAPGARLVGDLRTAAERQGTRRHPAARPEPGRGGVGEDRATAVLSMATVRTPRSACGPGSRRWTPRGNRRRRTPAFSAGMPVPAHIADRACQPCAPGTATAGLSGPGAASAGFAAVAATRTPRQPAPARPGLGGPPQPRLTRSPASTSGNVHRRADRDPAPLGDAPVEVGGGVDVDFLTQSRPGRQRQPGPVPCAASGGGGSSSASAETLSCRSFSQIRALAVVVGTLGQRAFPRRAGHRRHPALVPPGSARSIQDVKLGLPAALVTLDPSPCLPGPAG